MPSRTPARIAAQVAVEAIANEPDGYDDETRAAVLANGIAEGVAALYLDLIRRPESCDITCDRGTCGDRCDRSPHHVGAHLCYDHAMNGAQL